MYKGFSIDRLVTANVQRSLRSAFICFVVCASCFAALAQNKYEKHRIAKVDVSILGAGTNSPAFEQYRVIVREAVGSDYSSARIRDAIAALYNTKKVDTVTVLASLNTAGEVELRFDVKRKTQAEKVTIVVGRTVGDKITEQDLLFKLNLLTPGTAITEQTLRNNADQILDYLRERGFYRSDVVYARRPLQNENEVGVTFTVTPNGQTKVEKFNINIQGYDKPFLEKSLKLQKDGPYSRDRLLADVAKVREQLRKDDFLAPELEEPKVTFDSESNSISVALSGKVGPTVEVLVETEKGKLDGGTQSKLLPIKREGTLDYAGIVEGERRLENYYQEQGYFFANVTPVCSSTPSLTDTENNPVDNETEFLCSFLGGEDLIGRKVQVKYRVDLNRRLTLTDIRIKGTDKLTIEDIRTVLKSQEANLLGIIPVLGYGRGYTSAAILDDDAATIRSLMSELGYRDAQVRVNQGVTLNGEELIITFVVEEGVPTVVSGVTITGNKAVGTDKLLAELPVLTGRNYSRARIRNAVRKLSEYYSNQGYYDARVISSVIESAAAPKADKREVKIEFKIEGEGKKVVINRILINGNETTKTDAVLRTLTLRSGELLRSADIYSSEQNLYGTDAFSRVEIKPQPAGDTADGNRLTDIIVNLDEQPPRLLSYGGGFSTDLGLSGFFDIRHVNLFGNLWQGGARVKVSQKQQLVQFDFINPRFLRDGENRFAPLTFSVQYQRDSTVTRFFRSAFDRGTFGIVQRVDENGNPIDEFGAKIGSPTINRFGISAETSRTISRKNRSILFLRYKFEDVRLFKIESLLIRDLLRPDARTRISGFGATFVRDTRQNCSVKYSLLDLIAKGEQTEPCRYNASDPTRGDYLTADYNVSIPTLGANVGFQKFQANYNYYYTVSALKNTTFAGRAIIGLGSLFSKDTRFTSAQFPSLNGLLPISERFFAGGANTLRGFDFEEAGPRVVIVPQGSFRNSRREPVFLDPFTIPFGGNALAVVNLEARIPITKSVRAVPFYDGGNVFRKVGDIFKSPTVAANDVAGQNQRAVWSHTAGFGLRIKTPVGGEFGIDYGRLLNPPVFLIPQNMAPNAQYRLRQGQIHFRFSQAF
ncbi:MAG: POTRA domain-containing protein [Pyrinomonadaceae bacterium]